MTTEEAVEVVVGPTQWEKDHNCDLAKRTHAWQWVWKGQEWTCYRQCSTCGIVEKCGV